METKNKVLTPMELAQRNYGVDSHRFPDMLYKEDAVIDYQRLAYLKGLKDFHLTIDWDAMEDKFKKEYKASMQNSELVRIAMEETLKWVRAEIKSIVKSSI